LPRWRLIDKSLGLDLADPPETYHTSPHLFADLDIPAEISGTLPTAERTRAGLAAERLEDVEGRRGRRRRAAGGAATEADPRRTRRRSRRGGDAAAPAAADGAPAAGTAGTGGDAPGEAASRPRRRR